MERTNRAMVSAATTAGHAQTETSVHRDTKPMKCRSVRNKKLEQNKNRRVTLSIKCSYLAQKKEWSEEVRIRTSTPSPSSVDRMRVVSRD